MATDVPLAWMIWPLPAYMATWLPDWLPLELPTQKRRSPAWRLSTELELDIEACATDEWGMLTPAWE